jgi:thiamine biosynthesis lipoprotein
MHERDFRAMNTDVRIALNGDGPDVGRLLDQAAEEFAEHERRLSRFDPASDLSALNRAGARWLFVSPLLFHSLAAALAAYRRTGGLYDPAILSALEAAGYDRSFEQLAHPDAGAASGVEAASAGEALAAQPALRSGPPFELASGARAVCLAPGVRLDLGGIGKGLAVDAAAAHLTGQRGFLVDAGGDIRVDGQSPEGGLWGVAVQDPFDLDRNLAVLALTEGAVATSSAGRRRWLQDGTVRHHLIDPRTGRSTTGDVVAATVIASECATAEVLAKAVVIAGVEEGFELLRREQLPGLAVRADRRIVINEAMRPFLASGEIASVIEP